MKAFNAGGFLSAALIGVGWLALHPRLVNACSCPFVSGNDFLHHADVAFRGRVHKTIALAGDPLEGERAPYSIEFDVLASYRAASSPVVTVLSYAPDGPNCGLTTAIGEELVVFAHLLVNGPQRGNLYTSGCWALRARSETGLRALSVIGNGNPVGNVCPRFEPKMSDEDRYSARSSPRLFAGWGDRVNPNAPPSPYNPWRLWLEPHNPSRTISFYNQWTWKAGCSSR